LQVQGGLHRADKRVTDTAAEGSAVRARHRVEEPDPVGDGARDGTHRRDDGPVLGVPG